MDFFLWLIFMTIFFLFVSHIRTTEFPHAVVLLLYLTHLIDRMPWNVTEQRQRNIWNILLLVRARGGVSIPKMRITNIMRIGEWGGAWRPFISEFAHVSMPAPSECVCVWERDMPFWYYLSTCCGSWRVAPSSNPPNRNHGGEECCRLATYIQHDCLCTFDMWRRRRINDCRLNVDFFFVLVGTSPICVNWLKRMRDSGVVFLWSCIWTTNDRVSFTAHLALD